MSNKNKKMVIVPDETIEKAKALMEKSQIGNFTEVVKRAISYMYEETIDNYREAIKARAMKSPSTPLEKATAEIEAKEAKEKAKREYQTNLCVNVLKGRVDGSGFCWFKRYQLPIGPKAPVDIEEINTPLMELMPVDAEDQYRNADGTPCDKSIIEDRIK